MIHLRPRAPLSACCFFALASTVAAQTPFGPKTLTVGNFGPGATALGDVVGDAHADLVCTSGGLTIFESLGGGRFAAPIVVSAPQFQNVWGRVVLVDLDGDADLDVVAVSDREQSFGVLTTYRNLGGGSFAAPTSYGAGVYVAGLAAGDLDGDGAPEVVVGTSATGGTVRVYRNTGSGGLLPPQVLALGAGVNLCGLALADVDGDGDLDILAAAVVPGTPAAYALVILENSGSASFSPPQSVPALAGDAGIAVGDVDLDGDVDVALAGIGNTLEVLANDGSGGFSTTGVSPGTGETCLEVYAADLNGDGRADLATTTFQGELCVRLAVPGGFAPVVRLYTGSSTGASFADVDGDGTIDAAFPSPSLRQVAVLAGDGHGTLGGRSFFDLGTMGDFATGDLDGDGRADWIAGDGASPTLTVRRALPGGGVGAPTGFGTLLAANRIEVAHVDADPFLDVLVLDTGSGSVAWLSGDGVGGFSTAQATNVVGTHASRLWAGDANGDGLADLVLSYAYLASPGNFVEGTVLYLGDGAGGFTFARLVAHSSTAVAFGDFDGDGIDDVALSGPSHGEVWYSGGAGTAQVLRFGLASLLALDDDGDGDVDLFGAHANLGFERYPNLGASLGAPITLGGNSSEIRSGDLDGDGDLDLAVLGVGAGNAGWHSFLSNGAGGFADAGAVPGAYAGLRGALLDADGDGRTDLLLARSSPSGVVVIRNRGAVGGPVTYCTAKTTSNGCIPEIGASGLPSATATSGFVITSTHTINQKIGMLLHSIGGRAAAPFDGGTLCLHAPLLRGPIVSSGGNPPPDDCSGVHVLDFNAYSHGLGGGNPSGALALVGTSVTAQWWGRDPQSPTPGKSSLSNALDFVVGP